MAATWLELKPKLVEVLIDAFNEATFAQMLEFGCRKQWGHLVADRIPFPQKVNDVVNVAIREGWLDCLAREAGKVNKGHVALQLVTADVLAGIDAEGREFYQLSYTRMNVKPGAGSQEGRTVVDQAYLTAVYELVKDLFDESELQTLCFYLSIDYESLPVVGKANKARELVQYCARAERLADLREIMMKERSDIMWLDPDVPPATKNKEEEDDILTAYKPAPSIDIGVGGSVTGAAIGTNSKVEAQNIAGRDFISGDKVEQHFHVHFLSTDNLRKLYQESFPSTYEGDRTYQNFDAASQTMWQVVDSNNKRTGYASFINSLAKIIEKNDDTFADEIWKGLSILSQDSRNRIPSEEIGKNCGETPLDQDEEILLIEIEPRKIRKQGLASQFRVCFYPWCDGQISEKYFEETWFTIEEIPSHIAFALNNRYRGRIHVLELFVPIDILVHHSQFDQTEYQDDLDDIFGIETVPKRLGRAYEIVLRSLERQRTRLRHDEQWKKKWDHLTECVDVNTLAESLSLTRPGLEEYLQKWSSNKKKSLATLTIIKHQDLETKFKNVLGLLLGAGVPVVFWSRNTLSSPEDNDEREFACIWDKCCNKNYKHLWSVVHNLRKDEESLTNATYLGNHLTIVWDTPKRMLPTKKEFGE